MNMDIRTRSTTLLLSLAAISMALLSRPARAQESPDEPRPPSPPAASGQGLPVDFGGALQTVRTPSSAGAPGSAGRPIEIFPDASRVWMSVRDIDARPIEAARRGGPWLCANGTCSVASGDPGRSKVGDDMLRSIKLQTPTLPLPLTIWGRLGRDGERVLDFDPVLLGAPNPEVLHYTPMVWRETLGLRVAWTALAATPAPVRASRMEDGVRVEAGGASLEAPWAWTMYRTTPLPVGAVRRVGGMTVVVEEAPRGVPTRVLVRVVPGDVRWMQADRAGFTLTVVPTP